MGHGGYSMGNTQPDPSKKVEEITVDDVIHALTQALDNDKDVFEATRQIDSDPLFGKTKTGGTLGGFNLLNPDYFIKQIYSGADPNSIRMQISSQGYGYGGRHGYGSIHGYGGSHGYAGNYGYGGNSYGYGNQGYGYGSGHGYGGNYGHGGYGYGGNQGYGGSHGYGGNYGHGASQGYGGNQG